VATTGTVVELVDVRDDRDGAPVLRAVIQFQDREGKPHRFRSRSARSGSPWHIGDRFDVLYRPERPERAELKHEMPGMYGAFGVFAVVAVAASVFVLYVRRPTVSAGTGARRG
jgi:hypothetical protein